MFAFEDENSGYDDFNFDPYDHGDDGYDDWEPEGKCLGCGQHKLEATVMVIMAKVMNSPWMPCTDIEDGHEVLITHEPDSEDDEEIDTELKGMVASLCERGDIKTGWMCRNCMEKIFNIEVL